MTVNVHHIYFVCFVFQSTERISRLSAARLKKSVVFSCKVMIWLSVRRCPCRASHSPVLAGADNGCDSNVIYAFSSPRLDERRCDLIGHLLRSIDVDHPNTSDTLFVIVLHSVIHWTSCFGWNWQCHNNHNGTFVPGAVKHWICA